MNTDQIGAQRRNIEALGFVNADLYMRPRSTALSMITTGRSENWHGAPVYFAHTCDDEWLIKIGSSQNPFQRVRTLRAPSGARCELMAVIPSVGSIFEQWLHWYFVGLRVEGEWFTPWPPLLELIDRVNSVFPLSEQVAA